MTCGMLKLLGKHKISAACSGMSLKFITTKRGIERMADIENMRVAKIVIDVRRERRWEDPRGGERRGYP